MKKNYFYALGLLLIITVYGEPVFAAEQQSVTTNGNIQFEPNTTEKPVIDPPIDTPQIIAPEVPAGVTGPLTITYAPTMNFGSQEISNQDKEYSMIAEKQKSADGATDIPYVSFVQVQDTRGTNDGWTLSVTPSEFTNADTKNKTLKGAQITLTDTKLKYSSEKESAPSIPKQEMALTPGTATKVMTADKGKGAGTSSAYWGNQEELSNAKDSIVRNHAIKLSVPGKTVKDAVNYSASLTWKLETVPKNAI
jgi:hypothetical protein